MSGPAPRASAERAKKTMEDRRGAARFSGERRRAGVRTEAEAYEEARTWGMRRIKDRIPSSKRRFAPRADQRR